ncbi:hypothetical protein [Maricaulis salignorans]|uniref:Uncharacterized protein n=2 Tax=Maricaulis salignorans TaxID=144026 RepID=A0A1G9VPG8_9PROT|nr:hypothetical protein SAMN04488568_12031 [Maricaulis salignorans]
MAAPARHHDADWMASSEQLNPVLDEDILSFCVRSPQLVELAFTLADHGHTHVGHVARLTEFTLVDLANGDPSLARDLCRRLHKCGLDTAMELPGWHAPLNEAHAGQFD